MTGGGAMATIEENRRHWSSYDWSRRGDEWSEVWGDSDALWHTTVWPRIRPFLERAETVLEIAPGYGRMTHYLVEHCSRLVVVDLAEACITACKERFRDRDHVSCHVNDGRSLPMVPDRSVDFAFSFDSLIHADREAVEGYVDELARTLGPEGVGFLHHSNLHAFVDPETGVLDINNEHWRAEDFDARLFRERCASVGLSCIRQELVPWGGFPELIDCFSVFAIAGSGWDRQLEVMENPEFMLDAVKIGKIVKLYSFE
jgi:ubiquinone/menaquinone biosynthesis C-methylase UbiE